MKKKLQSSCSKIVLGRVFNRIFLSPVRCAWVTGLALELTCKKLEIDF